MGLPGKPDLFPIRTLILLLACLITPGCCYYDPTYGQTGSPQYSSVGRNYRYVLPAGNTADYYGDNFREPRYSAGGTGSFNSQADYPGTVVKNRRRSYAELPVVMPSTNGRAIYRPSFNDLDSGRPSSRVGTGGRWYSPTKRQTSSLGLKLDNHNRVQMGVENSMCDDAKTNLTNDWDMSPVNYTCFHPETRFPRTFNAEPMLECERLPPRYIPGHVCMDEKIPYKDPIPTHGDHRPLWPKFGEYMFVPRERWLHNIEHGAIVMLYHPCAYPSEVDRLRNLVRGCVGKHVITPSTLLSPERPLALVAWGCRLLMSEVDDQAVMDFIRTRAHKGPEGTYTKEGQYDLMLLKPAKSSGNGAKYGYTRVSCETGARSRF